MGESWRLGERPETDLAKRALMAPPMNLGLRIQLWLNLGGEGEAANCINQQPLWGDLSNIISRNGQPLRSLTTAGVPVPFCDNTSLVFPDSTIDAVITNGVPIDQATWLGPGISSNEIKRVLKPGSPWYDNGRLVYRKP